VTELYGILDPVTRDWTDGLLSRIFRDINKPTDKEERRYILFDGDVDALWIENMNSVMDDNKLLTLANGERIRLQNHCALLFEVLKNFRFITLSGHLHRKTHQVLKAMPHHKRHEKLDPILNCYGAVDVCIVHVCMRMPDLEAKVKLVLLRSCVLCLKALQFAFELPVGVYNIFHPGLQTSAPLDFYL
jgi:hypothetical protein